MHFYYVDPGLRNELGHHATSCRLIISELRRRDIGVSVFAHADIEPRLRAEIAAAPHFTRHTYSSADSDPVAGWLTSFTRIAADTARDLGRMPPPDRDDVVYLNSAQPAQLMALLTWMRDLHPARMPHVMVEFGTDPGIDHETIPEGIRWSLRDPRVDPRAVLYRHAASLLPQIDLSRLHLFTFEEMSSRLYGFLLKARVGVLPLPHVPRAEVRGRAGRRPLTVSVLGHQRPDKGYQLVPEIAEQLLSERQDIRVMVHNGAPQEMAETQQRLRALLAGRPQLTVDERLAGPALWQTLLDQSDVILCPYPAWRFASAYSAVAAEAVASGIPLVVPANTTLSELLARHGGGGTEFTAHQPGAIVAAVIQAIDRFDELAALALHGAEKWRDTMGAKSMVKALLGLAAPECGETERVSADAEGVSRP